MPKILLVEDDQTLRETCRTKFIHHGFDVLVAAEGEKGLRLALENHPDLIILDITLPDLDGLTVMEKLRESDWGKTARIMLLTNREPDDEILKVILKNNPSYYLVKANTSIDEVFDKANDILKTA